MALTLVLGPANSAKAAEVLGAYRAAARRGAILVVPTALDREHYRREVLADGAVLGGEVLGGGQSGAAFALRWPTSLTSSSGHSSPTPPVRSSGWWSASSGPRERGEQISRSI